MSIEDEAVRDSRHRKREEEEEQCEQRVTAPAPPRVIGEMKKPSVKQIRSEGGRRE